MALPLRRTPSRKDCSSSLFCRSCSSPAPTSSPNQDHPVGAWRAVVTASSQLQLTRRLPVDRSCRGSSPCASPAASAPEQAATLECLGMPASFPRRPAKICRQGARCRMCAGPPFHCADDGDLCAQARSHSRPVTTRSNSGCPDGGGAAPGAAAAPATLFTPCAVAAAAAVSAADVRVLGNASRAVILHGTM